MLSKALVKEGVELVDDIGLFLTVINQPVLFKTLVSSFISNSLIEVMHEGLPVVLPDKRMQLAELYH